MKLKKKKRKTAVKKKKKKREKSWSKGGTKRGITKMREREFRDSAREENGS